MTINPTQLMARVTTTAMETVKSVSKPRTGMPREEASWGWAAVSTRRLQAKIHNSTTPRSTRASRPISPGVTERMSPIKY